MLHDRFANLAVDDTYFAVLHGADRDYVETLVECGGFGCYGHHHVAEVWADGETTVVTPGYTMRSSRRNPGAS